MTAIIDEGFLGKNKKFANIVENCLCEANSDGQEGGAVVQDRLEWWAEGEKRIEAERWKAEREKERAEEAAFWDQLVEWSPKKIVALCKDKLLSYVLKTEQQGMLRFWLAARLRKEIIAAGRYKDFRTLCDCHRYPIPVWVKTKEGKSIPTGSNGVVEIHFYNDREKPKGGSLGLSWLQKCASSLICFMCASKIRFKRAEDIAKICLKLRKKGYVWIYGTFTAPHDFSTDPVEQIKLFSKAKRIFFSGDYTRKYKEDGPCIEEFIKAVELTLDHPLSKNKTGPHYHDHTIFFMKLDDYMTEEEAKALEAEWSKRWCDALIKVGICDESRRADVEKYGLKIELPRQLDLTGRSDEEIEQLMKQDALAKYESKGAAAEISPAIFAKDGKRPDRVSHWEYMALALISYPELVPNVLNILGVLKGKAAVRFSKGIQDKMIAIEKADADYMKEQRGVYVCDIDKTAMKKLSSYGAHRRLMTAIKSKAYHNLLNASAGWEGISEFRLGCFSCVVDVCKEMVKKIKEGIDPITGLALKVACYAPPIGSRFGWLDRWSSTSALVV